MSREIARPRDRSLSRSGAPALEKGGSFMRGSRVQSDGAGALLPVRARDFLLFLLGGDPYALPIGAISEILKLLPITDVPRAPSGIAGLASVRGRLVTVIDPRRRFGLAEPERDRRTRILLVDSMDETMGLLVDEVKGVHRFEEAQIEPPQVLGGEPPAHVAGVGRNDECWCMLLDLRHVLEVK